MRLTIRILCFGFYFLLLSSKLRSQVTTSNAFTPTQMVQNALLGSGITVSNVSYTGYGKRCDRCDLRWTDHQWKYGCQMHLHRGTIL